MALTLFFSPSYKAVAACAVSLLSKQGKSVIFANPHCNLQARQLPAIGRQLLWLATHFRPRSALVRARSYRRVNGSIKTAPASYSSGTPF